MWKVIRCGLWGLAVALIGTSAGAVDILGGRPTPMSLEVGKGELIRLETPAESVFIADPEIADVQVMSPTLIYVFARGPGETNLFAVDAQERLVANLRLHVGAQVGRLGEAMMEVGPYSNVELDSVENSLLLTGSVPSAAAAANVQGLAQEFVAEGGRVINNMIVTQPLQVNLRVRIAEVSREVTESLGFNWDALFNDGTLLLGLAVGTPVLSGTDLIVRNEGTDSIFASYRPDNWDLNAVIDALEGEGLVTILAEPNLTAMSGETASFLAGGEFPVPVGQDDNTITIEFKQFGISLAFTPTVLENGRISMRLRPEVSQLSDQGAITLAGIQVPALVTRRAETTVELGSGQSFAIAGLLSNSLTQNESQLPFFGDIPLLGPLFQSNDFTRRETELLIVCTPYLVEPVNARMPLPTDAIGELEGIERSAAGMRVAGIVAVGGDTPAPGLLAPAGFILN